MAKFARTLVLLAALQQAVFPAFVNPFAQGGHPRLLSGTPSQIVPAPYAFSIWGVIYLGALAYAVWQLTPSGRADAVTKRLAPLAIAIYLGSSIWLAIAQFGPVWATVPVLLAIAGCAAAALVVAMNPPVQTRARTWLVAVPFGLYAGWTACASFVNIADVAPQLGFNRFGLPVPAFGMLCIGGATLAACILSVYARGAIALAAAVIWALVAIIVAVIVNNYALSVAVAAGLGLAAMLVTTAAVKLRAV
ncbi:MAG TPA: hypothetical protein VG943_06695 [Caulobacterales bacterium]|nr:hypothetical protein [Caulobacterales bacterium]